MDALRAVPDVVIALVLIFVLSGGPIPAVIAIALHTSGALGKLFSEVAENADLKPVEGLTSTGASWGQRIWLVVVPQVAPNWASYVLMRFEINVRTSAILGFVGQGGIGYHLKLAMQWGQRRYDEVVAIFLILFLTIAAIDRFSDRVRTRLTKGAIMVHAALITTVAHSFQRRKIVALAIPALIFAYLLYAAVSFDVLGVAARVRLDNARIPLSDFCSYKVHVTRDNRSGRPSGARGPHMPKLSATEPFILPGCMLIDSQFFSRCEVGEGSRILYSTLQDFAYCDRLSDIANTTVGKFANIAALTRIGPTDLPYTNASLHHFLYRSGSYRDDIPDDADFMAHRRSRRTVIGPDTWLGHGVIVKHEVIIGAGAIIASAAQNLRPELRGHQADGPCQTGVPDRHRRPDRRLVGPGPRTVLGQNAPPRKAHGYLARSYFRTGFTHLRNLLRANDPKIVIEWARLKITGILTRVVKCA